MNGSNKNVSLYALILDISQTKSIVNTLSEVITSPVQVPCLTIIPQYSSPMAHSVIMECLSIVTSTAPGQ
jgi:hypothetical protein